MIADRLSDFEYKIQNKPTTKKNTQTFHYVHPTNTENQSKLIFLYC